MPLKNAKSTKSNVVLSDQIKTEDKSVPDLRTYKFDTSAYTYMPSPVRRDIETGRLVSITKNKTKK